jgi:hypothetical protein
MPVLRTDGVRAATADESLELGVRADSAAATGDMREAGMDKVDLEDFDWSDVSAAPRLATSAVGSIFATMIKSTFTLESKMVSIRHQSESEMNTQPLTQLEFTGDDFKHAEKLARKLGYAQTADNREALRHFRHG